MLIIADEPSSDRGVIDGDRYRSVHCPPNSCHSLSSGTNAIHRIHSLASLYDGPKTRDVAGADQRDEPATELMANDTIDSRLARASASLGPETAKRAGHTSPHPVPYWARMATPRMR
jgi:hypothetical protein